jgi:urease accessory protein
MTAADPITAGWTAQLALRFERRGSRTDLVRRQHRGPLVVQKSLHPEGDSPCHALILHPPAGVVGGDELTLTVEVGPDAEALLTTPGATKWYRSQGPVARSATHLRVEAGGVLEYLPREAIVFDGAQASATLTLEVAADACALAWDTWCLGRTHAGERFACGHLELLTRVVVAGKEVLFERAAPTGGAPLLRAAAGLAEAPVFATFMAVGLTLDAETLAACRALPVGAGRGGLTQLPGVLCARYLGHSTEAAHAWCVALWQHWRPWVRGRVATPPRIWAV